MVSNFEKKNSLNGKRRNEFHLFIHLPRGGAGNHMFIGNTRAINIIKSVTAEI
jgi:hypothetical protein